MIQIFVDINFIKQSMLIKNTRWDERNIQFVAFEITANKIAT